MELLHIMTLFVSSRATLEEYPTYDRENVFMFSLGVDEILPSKNRYAYVTSLTADDSQDHYAISLIVLAASLKNMSKSEDIDRILIIPDNFQINGVFYAQMESHFTHIYRMQHPDYPCEKNFRSPADRHHWFKLNAWLLTRYEKILYVGHNNVFIRDPSGIFDFPAPAAPLDFKIWSNSEFGPVHNCDFMLIQPSEEVYEGLLRQACDWLHTPHLGGSRSLLKNPPNVGAFDNGVIEEYYAGNITTLPIIWNYEVLESQDMLSNRPRKLYQPGIISYRFSQKTLPWKVTHSILSQAWTLLFQRYIRPFGGIIDWHSLGYQRQTENISLKILKKDPKSDDAIKYEHLFEDYSETTFKIVLIRSLLIISTSLALLIRSISKSTHFSSH